MLHVKVCPVAQKGLPRAQRMYMDGPARVVDITSSLFLSSVLEYVSHGQVTDRKQPRSYAGIHVACITAVKEPN